jgi:hypothetical protein
MMRESSLDLKNIDLVRDKDMWCDEMIYATVATCLNRHYELMFYDFWNFQYIEEPGLSASQRVQYFNPNMKDNLTKYHGIIINSFDASNKPLMLKTIREQLTQNKPCKITFDAYYSTWVPDDERQNHQELPFLVIGEAEDKSGFILRDPHNNDVLKKPVVLKTDDLLKGCRGYEIFSVSDQNYGIDNLEDFIHSTAKMIRSYNMFENLKKYSNSIRSNLNFSEEIEGVKDPQQALIISEIIMLARSREFYTSMLNYLANTYADGELLKIAENFSVVSGIWHMAKASLLKGFYHKCFDQTDCDKLAEKLDEISDCENSICRLMEKYKSLDDKQSQDRNSVEGNRISIVTTVDLKPYFNGKGCFHQAISTSPADFTGVSEYLLVDSKYSEKIIRVDDSAVFQFPEIISGRNDNLTCNGQTIKFEKGNYNHIYFLASCEFDDFSAMFTLQYVDGEEDVTVSISNFWDEKPMYDDKIALSVKKVYIKAEEAHIDDRLYNLYYSKRKIDPERRLVGIKLPDCPNMHILGITLDRI